MKVKTIQNDDFVNYKKCSLFIGMPYCNFKCEKECGIKCCQNNPLALSPIIEVDTKQLITKYIADPFMSAVVFGGLEPLDSFSELQNFIADFRLVSNDDIVIYTGYNEDEVSPQIVELVQFKNIIVKFGRFIPNDESHYDEVLGVILASHNQYAKKIS